MNLPSAVAVLLAAALAAAPAPAAELAIALGADVTSIDPHFHNLTPNNNIGQHVFETLVAKDARGRLKPALAESWRPVDELTWEFRLRKDVKFHDGSAFTAADVMFSIDRVPNVPGSPSPFTTYTKQITEKTAPDPYTLRLRTAAPYPQMPNDLGTVLIVSARAAANATTDDFNTGKAAIGTGPFRFVRWTRGDRIELVRNDAYWGPKPAWERVTLRIITADPSRVAALLSGDVRAVENVPTSDLKRLGANKDLTIHRTVSVRLMYLHMDTARERSPFVTDKAGRPLDRNPLRDARVRRALSMAINRQALVDRVMEGAAVPTGQLMPAGFFGHAPGMKVDPSDPEGAKRLLAEAGYPDGFGLTLHAPNNRYVNDEQVAQAVAQMLARIGIATRVDAMPSSVFFSRGSRLEFSFLLAGWGAETMEASSPLKALLATFSKEKGMGAANRGRYSNPKMDAVLEQALATVDDGRRERLLQQATEIGVGDLGIIPLYHQHNLWATRRGLTYEARADERTLAYEFRPQ
ncbi:MAG: ABC transporter substrate-binding protein [Burkholderiales bacterium]|nr:ABC transporter substrate-binding protein [Burkholderiales bacterium]